MIIIMKMSINRKAIRRFKRTMGMRLRTWKKRRKMGRKRKKILINKNDISTI